MLEKLKSLNWKEIFSSIVWAGILALLIRTTIFEPYQVVSGSMKKTLMVDDYLILTKYDYGFSKYSFMVKLPFMQGRVFFSPPQRGDVVVFKLPSDTSISYIKRLIGLPGDEIQMIGGELHLNGTKVPRVPKGTFADEGEKGEEIYSVFEETLPNGISYLILDLKNDLPQDDTPIYKVPENTYFFLGDNRDRSIDSRFLADVGYIPEENLVGKAKFLVMTHDFKWINFLTKFDYGRVATKLYGSN